MDPLVPQKNLHVHHPNYLTGMIAFIVIWSVLPSLMWVDLVITLYQQIYFSIMKIPQIDRRKFIKIERYRLGKLNVLQKASCAYCEYANGLTSYAKAIANQTEIYSCAIKYPHHFPGQEYQKHFYPEKKFE